MLENENTIAVPAHRPCPLARKCGGCQLQNLSYPEQLRWKQNRVRSLLGKFCTPEPILAMEDPTHYRCKVQAAFGLDKNRRIVSGVYQSSTHRIVPVTDCMIEDRTADKIIADIRAMMPRYKMQAYDEASGTGFLRHVLVRRGYETGQVMVVLVTARPIFSLQKPFLAELLKNHPEIVTVVQNINDKFTPLVLGRQEKVLFGPGYIEDRLCSLTFRISAKSFYQVNPAQTQKLYDTAIEYAALTGRERVLDAYCGTGTIGLAASRQAGEVLGVELNRDAVRDAVANARRNDIENCRFAQGDAGAFMEDLAAQGEPADVVFLDPPRAGSDERFLASLVKMAPPRVVYVSCNPETLARDLDFLTARGYKVRKIQPVDMFPFTQHVETVVQLYKGNISSQKIRVEFDL